MRHAILAALAVLAPLPSCPAGDWPQILGPERNGIAAADERLADRWPAAGPREVWRRNVGAGYAGVAVAAGRAMLDLGPRFVVIKKGEHGAILVHRDGLAALPAYPADQVIDPTGAGDTFAGGMMGYLASSEKAVDDPGSYANIRQALVHGTVVASFNIEAFSLARLRTLTKGEIESRVTEFTNMIRV